MMHDPLDHQDMMLGDQFFSSKKVSSIFWMLELTWLYLKYAFLCGLAQCDSNYDVATTTANSGIECNILFGGLIILGNRGMALPCSLLLFITHRF